MSDIQPYNPLEKLNLAESISRAIISSDARSLKDTDNLIGAGIYVIYYSGSLEWYAPISQRNKNNSFNQPIYVGKAIPKGGRKGGLSADSTKGKPLRERLGQHRESIDQVNNLELNDFHYRSLIVDDIWIPLGENMLIEQFKPVWNLVIDGFGNKDPGNRRKTQHRSPWDVIHPGRDFAKKLADNPKTMDDIVLVLKKHFENE